MAHSQGMVGQPQDALEPLKAALRDAGRDAEGATLVAAAATLRQPGKTFLPPAAEAAFKSECLGPLFARYAVQKGRAVEHAAADGQVGWVAKLGRYHFHVDPALVPSANNHPFQDWLDRLRDFTGTHSLSPAPLVPWPVFRGTVLHALSCCLVGLEHYWKALALAVAHELNGDNYARYRALVGRGVAAEDELDWLIAVLNPEAEEGWTGSLPTGTHPEAPHSVAAAAAGEEHGGMHVFFHPIVVQAASNVLGRVIVVFDFLGSGSGAAAGRSGSGARGGVFAPWVGAGGDAGLKAAREPLPPLCIAWENKEGTRVVPVVPAALAEEACCVLPDPLVPPLMFARLHTLEGGGPGTWEAVKAEELVVDRQRRCRLLSRGGKRMTPQYMRELLRVMTRMFRRVTGVALQAVADVRSALFDLGIGEVRAEELVWETAVALQTGRVFYHPVCCCVTVSRGLYSPEDLSAPNGRLYLEALRERAAGAGGGGAGSAEQGAAVTGRVAGGMRLKGVDVPVSMPPGMLRVMVSVERVEGGRGEGAAEEVPESVVLVVSNTSPGGSVRRARVSKVLADVEVVLGLEVKLLEAGEHKIGISLSPVYAPEHVGGGGAPLTVAVLDGGEYSVTVQEGVVERRTNQGQGGAVLDYSQGIRLPSEPACVFSLGAAGLVPADSISCRVMGQPGSLRVLSAGGDPAYQNGDCTHAASAPGVCVCVCVCVCVYYLCIHTEALRVLWVVLLRVGVSV